MSDVYLPSFFTADPKTGAGTPTYAQLEARRKIAMALATRNRPYPKTIGEGLTALGEGLGEGFNLSQLQSAEAAQAARDAAGAVRLQGDAPAAASGQTSSVDDPAINALALANASDIPPAETATAAAQAASMSPTELLTRLARNETGAESNPYRAIGQRNRRGDYPLGKYQVMGENVPEWSKMYLGKEITPQEFLLDNKAQDQIALGRGSEYLEKYGPNGAAEAWFAGEKGRIDGRTTRPNLGRHLDAYVEKFNRPLIGRNEVTASAMNAPAFAAEESAAPPVQLASLGGAPTPDTVADPAALDMVAQALTAQQQPAPPPPQQIAQAGGALPAVPPSMPIVSPQAIPKAPVTPAQPNDPGPEPKLRDFTEGNPTIKHQMTEAAKVRDNAIYSDPLRARAAKRYEELQNEAKEAYKQKWTVWHEDANTRKKFELDKEKRDLETTKLRGETEDAAIARIEQQRFGMDPKEWHKNFKVEQNSAEVAGRMMSDNQLIIKAVKDGVIMGTGAGWRLNVAKLAAWAAQNGYASEVAANSEIARALSGSRIREAMSQINPSGPASNVDLLISKQLSGTDPVMEPKSFMTLLHKSNEFNAKVLNDFEDKRDFFLSGTRAERNYAINTSPTAPKEYIDALLQNRDDKAARAAYNERFGDGAAQLEIERFKRRTRRGQ